MVQDFYGRPWFFSDKQTPKMLDEADPLLLVASPTPSPGSITPDWGGSGSSTLQSLEDGSPSFPLGMPFLGLSQLLVVCGNLPLSRENALLETKSR